MFLRTIATCTLLGLAFLGFAQSAPRKIQKLDQLKIVCEEESLLSKTYRVSKDGIILVDFLGAVEVQGLTEQEAADRLAKRLVEDRILRKATVAVKSLEAQPSESTPGTAPDPVVPEQAPPAEQVKVLTVKAVDTKGVVQEVPYRDGMTLADVVKSSGIGDEADLSKTILKSSDGKTRLVDGRTPVVLGPDDEVVFTAKAPEPPIEVMVFGGVASPGLVKLSAPYTLRGAIAAAGGIRGDGIKKKIRVERDGEAALNLDLTAETSDAPLKANDRVVVEVSEERAYVQVEGAVNSPGFFVASPGMKLGEALAAAGGVTARAKLDRVQVFKPGVKKPVLVNFKEIEQGYSGDVTLGAGDRVAVPSNERKNTSGLKLAAGAVAAWLLFGR